MAHALHGVSPEQRTFCRRHQSQATLLGARSLAFCTRFCGAERGIRGAVAVLVKLEQMYPLRTQLPQAWRGFAASVSQCSRRVRHSTQPTEGVEVTSRVLSVSAGW
jgi:hypothetical protein